MTAVSTCWLQLAHNCQSTDKHLCVHCKLLIPKTNVKHIGDLVLNLQYIKQILVVLHPPLCSLSSHPLSLCPSLYRLLAHDCCEVVSVTLCSVSQGVAKAPEDLKPCVGRVAPLAEQRFSFVQDLAFDMAQFLVSISHFHFLEGKQTQKLRLVTEEEKNWLPLVTSDTAMRTK